MGIGSSRDDIELRPRQSRIPNSRNRTRNRPRRAPFRRGRSTSRIQPSVPVRQHSSPRYSYGFEQFGSPFAQQSPLYPGYMPTPYNNYGMPPYMPPQQFQPMVMPQNIQPSYPMVMPQQVPSPVYPPYGSSPYPASIPAPRTYVQQPPPVQSYYNNVGAYTPMSAPYVQSAAPPYNTVRIAPPVSTPYVPPAPAFSNNVAVSVPAPTAPPNPFSQYPTVPTRVITDWTRGGVISPGFLGPPI